MWVRTDPVMFSFPRMQNTPAASESKRNTSNSSSSPTFISAGICSGLGMEALKQPCTKQPMWLEDTLLTVPWEEKEEINVKKGPKELTDKSNFISFKLIFKEKTSK